jgi:hypothetical protein
MPFCEECDRFYTPSTLTPAGDCPAGHHVADPGDAPPIVQSAAAGRDETDPKQRTTAPWHFWLLVAAVVLYLGWRLIQGIGWLFG